MVQYQRYGPQDNMTLKMSTFKWVHVLLLQLNSGISLPSPDLCNSAVESGVGIASEFPANSRAGQIKLSLLRWEWA